jgi:fumarylacetoacetase
MEDVEMQLPVFLLGITDFTLVKNMLQTWKNVPDPENALLPNWLHIPVGYHGRSSSFLWNSGSQTNGTNTTKWRNYTGFGPSRSVDFELRPHSLQPM